MAYATTNPPYVLLSESPLQGKNTIWGYTSADAVATVAGAGYFSDALQRGMQLNDIVIVWDTATPLVSTCRVTSVSTTNNSVTLAGGTTIGA